MSRVKYLLSVLLLLTKSTLACSMDPESNSSTSANPYEKLVSKANVIVLAKVVSVKENKYRNEYTFEVKEHLKGKYSYNFILEGYPAEKRRDNYSSDFDEHKLPRFWAFGYLHNSISPGDCKNYGYYSIGYEYLLMIDRNNNSFSHENIKTENDLWFNIIKLWVDTSK